jgi:steroid 5-alpha reductase family enzyme
MGFGLEVTADLYLAWFKKQAHNKGKICTTGPWKICRFPNYLGEVTLWYGVYLICLNEHSWMTIIGPLAIHFLIVNISGIPFLEKRYQERPEYKEYSKRVPRFFPLRISSKNEAERE